MPFNRRHFIQTSLLAGGGILLKPLSISGKTSANAYFGLHPFILKNPDAVFIMRTQVDAKTNADAIKAAGLDFGRSVFSLTDNEKDGIPLTHKIAIKPNLTCRQSGSAKYTVEGSMGIVTDVNFVEGIIDRFMELGIEASQIFIREVNCPDDMDDSGYTAMAERTGIDAQAIDTPVDQLPAEKVVWKEVPDGVWFNKIPYLWPINAPDTWLLNISKFKAHGMGLTLCAKNLQGTIAMNYQAHCTAFGDIMYGVDVNHIKKEANSTILNNYNRHKSNGIPRWDKPGSSGGIWMEAWASRCLDNNSVNFAGLHIIEGIYGRDGNFLEGPGKDNLATDYMTNYIIFGRNQFHVDNIGHYLGGHEPGNFGLFHLAIERGMATKLNPRDIDVYLWDQENEPVKANLSELNRYPLKTYYLQKNYGNNTEDRWHMVDEAYEYVQSTGSNRFINNSNISSIQVVSLNSSESSSLIKFYIPVNGHVKVEIIDFNGQVISMPINKILNHGSHTFNLNNTPYSPGIYFCRLHFGSEIKTNKFMIGR
jgi:hypothetical protein